jgi:hypothetical protein
MTCSANMTLHWSAYMSVDMLNETYLTYDNPLTLSKVIERPILNLDKT